MVDGWKLDLSNNLNKQKNYLVNNQCVAFLEFFRPQA